MHETLDRLLAGQPAPSTGQQQPEKYNFTEAYIKALLDGVTGDTAGPSSAEEAAAGLMGRSFAMAAVTGPHAGYFDCEVMVTIGRELVLNGESIWRVGEGLTWLQNYELMAGRYKVGDKTTDPQNILHVRYARDWMTGRGQAPLGGSPSTRQLTRQQETGLMHETNAPVAKLVPVPHSGDTLDDMLAKIKTKKGDIMFVDSTTAGWGDTKSAPRGDYDVKSIGSDPSSGALQLWQRGQQSSFSVLGIPYGIIDASNPGAMREGWRVFLHSTLQPLGCMLIDAAASASMQIDINWDRLMASDLMGRARAFGSLTQAGISREDAARICAFELSSDYPAEEAADDSDNV